MTLGFNPFLNLQSDSTKHINSLPEKGKSNPASNMNLFSSDPFSQMSMQNFQFNNNSLFNFSPLSLGFPANFDTMMMNWDENISEIETIFLNALKTMPQVIPHVAKPQIRPLDYTKYDSTNSEKIQELNPKMQEKTMQLLDFAKSKFEGSNKSVLITSGYRTKEEQQYLLDTKPHLAAKNSAHCEGKAIDISITGGTDEDYEALGNYAKSIGMRWGGDFSKEKERWHFDYDWR